MTKKKGPLDGIVKLYGKLADGTIFEGEAKGRFEE